MTQRGVLNVAACQFATGASVKRNAARIRAQIAEARRLGADVVHFPEAALTGYVGTDFKSWDGFDWDNLVEETRSIMRAAKENGLWVILGSAHRLSDGRLPHNCLYAIDSRGRIVDRYDKRFCTGGDLKHYTPGGHFAAFTVNGVKCSALICYDVRFPELCRELKKRGVQLVFHSFYNARAKGRNVHTDVMRPSLQTHAATNYFWISATNPSGYYQSWPSVFIRPNGRIVGTLRMHHAGVMVNTVDTRQKFYDASGPNRDLAMRGELHNGQLADDPRSEDRTCL